MSCSGNRIPGPADERPAAIGHHLQSIRKKRGLTQRQLGKKIGVSREAIASYEAGRSHLTDLILMDLADALRVSTDEILGLQSPPVESVPVSRRLMKRVVIIESLPEGVKKRVIRTLDDSIKANTHLSILDD
ncbi:MAG: helix-turn-helix domain-containing protein [Spirochaetaceae bacterium]|jgi:transcriptional regulator with XRE-family HTH domain|nr:helix-turn-helix domain-containing protein [Spirochaetaceae bacterium]